MKVWSTAANEMKEQGNEMALDKFWPLVDSQAVINKHSPTKKGKEKAQEEDIKVEEHRKIYILLKILLLNNYG